MLFTKIALTRFGPHKSLVMEGLSNLVGLIGPSGRGKTHIMQAIELLLNGKIEKTDKIETFVYDYGVEGIDPTAAVEGWFESDGRQGRLLRTFGVGKRAGRELEWDGKIYKSDADVSEKLDELFDVGKRSLAATVFLRQGEIRSGLFTTPTAREDLMIRILSMEWAAKVADAASKKKAAVLGKLPDLGPARDQAAFSYNQADVDYTNAVNLLASAVDFSPDIQSLRNLDQARKSLEAANQNVQACTTAETQQRLAMDALLAETQESNSVEGFALITETARTDAQSATNYLTNLQHTAQMVATRDSLQRTVTSLTAEIAALNTERPGIAILASPEKLRNLEQLAATVEAGNRLRGRITQGTALIKNVELNIEALGARPLPVDHATEIATLDQRMRDLAPAVSLLQSFQRAGGDVNCGTCPTCKTALNAASFDLKACAEAVTTTTQCGDRIRLLQQEETVARNAIARWDQNSAVAVQQLESHRRLLNDLETELAALNVPAECPPDLAEQIATQQRLVAKLQSIDHNLAAKGPELARCQEQLKGLPTDLPVSVDLQGAQDTATAAATRFHTLSARLATLQSAVRKGEELAAITESHKRVLASATETLTTVDAAVTTQARATLGILQGEIATAIADLETKQAAWLSADSARAVAFRNREGAAQRLNALDQQIAQQAKQRIIADKLERLAKAFGRTGVPSAIVQDRWGMLIALTQAYLRQSEAPFSIRVSKDQPVSIDFLLHNRPSAGYRPMTKMSGGEGMVFAVRFAFAVQQLLTPRLGLLSLDEPSTHLDADGTQQLGAVLKGLASRLKNSSAQVWVTDHNPLLIPCFSTVVELPALKPEGTEIEA